MKKLLIAIITIIAVLSCAVPKEMYVQKYIKTEKGYKKVGDYYKHKVKIGDTISVLSYTKPK